MSAGWLEQPVQRVYRHGPGPLKWEQVVVSLQTLLEVPLVVGGLTALQLQGFSHYLAQEIREVHLYGPVPPPTWVGKLSLNVIVRYHNSARLLAADAAAHGQGSSLEVGSSPQGSGDASLRGGQEMNWGSGNWPLAISTPERAFLELLDELPSRESFHQADKLMEGLPSLSPRRLAKLLANCRSVKVKRLFFFFADRHSHAWRRHLDPTDFDLGSGKRVLARGGKFDPRYQITVPEDFGSEA